MSIIANLQWSVTTFLLLALVVATVIALIDAATRRAEAFEAAGKLTKNAWLLILGVAAAVEIVLQGLGLLISAVATIVYYVDVRPAVSAMTRRR